MYGIDYLSKSCCFGTCNLDARFLSLREESANAFEACEHYLSSHPQEGDVYISIVGDPMGELYGRSWEASLAAVLSGANDSFITGSIDEVDHDGRGTTLKIGGIRGAASKSTLGQDLIVPSANKLEAPFNRNIDRISI